MAQFSKASFGFSAYAAFRPVYPKSLYTYLFNYHFPTPKNVLVDLGCGPGTVTQPLSEHFQRVIGVDPSEGMISQAHELTSEAKYPNISYVKSKAETLPFLEDKSVDMVVAAQAAHWFSYPAWWKEMARVIRPGGTLACWGYKDHVLVDFPRATQVLERYAYGSDKWGSYWGQPGRSIVQGRLRAIRPNDKEWKNVERWEYEPSFRASLGVVQARDEVVPESEEEQKLKAGVFGKLVKTHEGMLKKTMKLKDVEEYTRTWSSVHAWLEAHPEEKRRSKENPNDRDTVDEMFDEMTKAEENWGLKEGEDWREKEVEVEWGHAVVIMKRSDVTL